MEAKRSIHRNEAIHLLALLAFFVVLCAFAAVLFFDRGAAWLSSRRDFLIVALLVVFSALMFSLISEFVAAQHRRAVLVCCLASAITIGVLTLFQKEGAERIRVARMLLVGAACLIPTYLHLSYVTGAARNSQDFLATLRRFGLLVPQPTTDPARLREYLRTFEERHGTHSDHHEIVRAIGLSRTEGSREVSGGVLRSTSSTALFHVSSLTVMVGLGWVFVFQDTGIEDMTLIEGVVPKKTVVAMAFLGSYFLSVTSLFARFIRDDLAPKAFLGATIRVFCALIVSISFAQALPDETDNELILAAAFCLGLVPRMSMSVVLSTLHSRLRKHDSSRSVERLSRVHGLSVWHRIRLEEEGIDSLSLLASSDPVHLVFRTGNPPERIVNWIDEAKLLMYFRPDSDQKSLDQLARRGVRRATQVWVQHLECKGDLKGNDSERLVNLVRDIRHDPNFQLVLAWRGLHQAKIQNGQS